MKITEKTQNVNLQTFIMNLIVAHVALAFNK